MSANVLNIVIHIILNSPSLIKDIANMVSDYKKGNYQQFGQELGDIVYRILLK